MGNFFVNFKTIFRISLPLTLGSASSILLTLEDSYFAGKIGADAFNAIFLLLPLVGLNSAFGAGIAGAIGDLLAKSKKISEIKIHCITTLAFATLFCLVVLVIVTISPTLVHSLSFGNKIDVQSNIYKLFSQYWDIVKWSLPLQIFFSISIQILNILKKDKIGILIILVCNLLNIIGNFLFTQIYPFGIKGLGYSTVIVFLSGLIVALIYISKAEFIGADLNRKDADRFKKSIRKLSINSILIFLSIGVFNIGSLIFNHLALSISSNTLIIYGVSSQIRQMFSLTTRGFSGGFLVQLGAVIKERQYSSIIPIYWSATLWIGIIYGLGCLLMMITPNSLINIFGNTSQNLTAHISYFLFIGGFILLIQILPRMSQIGFLSIESPHYLVIQSVFLVFIESLLAYYLIQISGYKGLILGQLLGNLLTTIIFVPLFFYLIQKKFKYAIR